MSHPLSSFPAVRPELAVLILQCARELSSNLSPWVSVSSSKGPASFTSEP
jgi:hypothetical protein